MLTILLVSLFVLLMIMCAVLSTTERLSDAAPSGSEREPRHRMRPRDPFAPILRAGTDTDDATTVRMVGAK